MLLSIDGMDQSKTALPHELRNSKDSDAYPGIGVHATSVFIFGGLVPIIGFLNLPDVEKNSSLTVTLIHRALGLQWEAQINKHSKLVNWPPRLHICFDNAPGENMNANVFMYLSWLVHVGVFREITIGTLLVGHTHNINDQLFSVWSRSLNHSNCYTLSEMMELFKKYTGKVKDTSSHEPQAPQHVPSQIVSEPVPVSLISEYDGVQLRAFPADQRVKVKKALLQAVEDIQGAVSQATPHMEVINYNASIESWLGSSMNRVAFEKITKYHVFKFVKNPQGQTQLFLKFVQNAERTYSAVPHVFSHAGVNYRSLRTVLEPHQTLDWDPLRLPYVPFDTTCVRAEIKQLTTEKAMTPAQVTELELMCDRLDEQNLTQRGGCALCTGLLEKWITAELVVIPRSGPSVGESRTQRRQNIDKAREKLIEHGRLPHPQQQCAVCGDLADRRNRIGVLHQPSKDAPQAELERHSQSTRLRKKLSDVLTSHLHTSRTSATHAAQSLDGWWTIWIQERIPVIRALWHSKGVADLIEHDPSNGILAHPADDTRQEVYSNTRTEQTCFESVGEPAPDMIGIFRCNRESGKPPFWVGKLGRYHNQQQDIDMTTEEEKSKESETIQQRKKNKDQLSAPKVNIFSRSHIAVQWYNHIEPQFSMVELPSVAAAAAAVPAQPVARAKKARKAKEKTKPVQDDGQGEEVESTYQESLTESPLKRAKKHVQPPSAVKNFSSFPLSGPILPAHLEAFKGLVYCLTEESQDLEVSTLAWWGHPKDIFTAQKKLTKKAWDQIVRDLSQEKI